jgi:hypothetical protein
MPTRHKHMTARQFRAAPPLVTLHARRSAAASHEVAQVSDLQRNRSAHEYVWFALLLILILATSAVHAPAPDTASTLPESTAP